MIYWDNPGISDTLLHYTPTKRMFSGVYWNHPVCSSVYVSIYVQNTSSCQSPGGGIKSHLLTALVSYVPAYVLSYIRYISL